MKKKPPTKIIYRSAVDGRFVTKEFVEKHPDTTVKEKREVKSKKNN
jgi:hypothetical protein